MTSYDAFTTATLLVFCLVGYYLNQSVRNLTKSVEYINATTQGQIATVKILEDRIEYLEDKSEASR